MMNPAAKMPSSGRYFPNSHNTTVVVNARDELLACLERINTLNPPVQTCSTGWAFHGLYAGPTSIAYLFYRLYAIYPDLEFKNQSLLDWAQAYLDLSRHVPERNPDPDHCGIANETLAYTTLQAVIVGDPSLANKLCSYQSLVNSRADGSNEWLYGRAGYLYFLRLARSHFSSTEYLTSYKQLTEAMQKTIERMFQVPLPWTWHGSEYLGAAHGVVGIICQIVLSDPAAASHLERLLSDLLDQQFPSGNFPSSTSASSDNLVQFCHGGPGFVLSLKSVLPFFPSLKPRLEEAIERARQDTWSRGLLTKAPCLCHGIPGNALAFGDSHRMQQFLTHMTTSSLEQHGWMEKAGHSDDFVSLYTGEAGRAWVWAILDRDQPTTCIGYNDV